MHTDTDLTNMLEQEVSDCHENIGEITNELSAWSRIEDARTTQHANQAVADAAIALTTAIRVRSRIWEMVEHTAMLRNEMDVLHNEIDEHDEDLTHLRQVEDAFRHNAAIIRNMRVEVTALKVPRRIIEVERP